MPRKAPDNVQEMRVTFGTYERQFVTEIKQDLEKTVKVAAIIPFALPIGAAVGLGLLGYGILKAGQSIGKGLNEFSMLDWKTPDVVKDVKDAWTDIKWGGLRDPLGPMPEGKETPTLEELDYATKDYSFIQTQELWLYVVTGGKFGKSHEQIQAEIDAVANGGGGGDF